MPISQALDALSNWPALAVIAIITVIFQPLRVLLMGLVFRCIGVPKDKIAKWALKHADSFRFLEVLQVLRSPSKPDIDKAKGGTPPDDVKDDPPPDRPDEPPRPHVVK